MRRIGADAHLSACKTHFEEQGPVQCVYGPCHASIIKVLRLSRLCHVVRQHVLLQTGYCPSIWQHIVRHSRAHPNHTSSIHQLELHGFCTAACELSHQVLVMQVCSCGEAWAMSLLVLFTCCITHVLSSGIACLYTTLGADDGATLKQSTAACANFVVTQPTLVTPTASCLWI